MRSPRAHAAAALRALAPPVRPRAASRAPTAPSTLCVRAAGRRAAALRASLALAVALCALASTGCGHHDSPRDRVTAYIGQVNAVERSVTPAFEHAERAYRELSSSQGTRSATVAAVARAERTIRAARRRLAAVSAPAPARRLRRLVLAAFDRTLELAHETTLLARYQPAAKAALRGLDPANAALRTGLHDGAADAERIDALATYAADLRAIVTRLRALHPPPALRPGYRAELRRLTETASLADDLRTAITAHDAPAVAATLLRFRETTGTDAATLRGQRRAVAAYRRRTAAIGRAQSRIVREQARLNRELR